jgi:hypothetical protein
MQTSGLRQRATITATVTIELDRGGLKKSGGVEEALVWDRFHPRVTAAKLPLSPANLPTEPVPNPKASGFDEWEWLLSALFLIAYLGAIGLMPLGWLQKRFIICQNMGCRL